MSLPVEKLADHFPPPVNPASVPSGLTLNVIEARSGWQPLDLGELWRFRELVYFLAWRDVKVRYKQTLLGAAWAILQPTMMMVVFTLVLGRIAGGAEGDVPYPLFVYAGLLPWTFFATAITSAGQSVVSAERLVTKIYFPRLAIPLAAAGAALVDFALAAVVMGVLMAWYGVAPGWAALLLPALCVLLALAALGVGTLLAALNVAYRDVRHVIPFLVQLWFFATPSIYLQPSAEFAVKAQAPIASTASEGAVAENVAGQSTKKLSVDGIRWLSFNPLEGLIAFFRAALLGMPLPWARLVYPAIAAPCLLLAGAFYFRRVEDTFADII
ncbi:MAG TPA: ABC transporter permease [Pirellulales bacterium]|nr:ABC transporter permease [Pirellulales bacterium]